METPLTYDMMLEVEGVLRSQNLRVRLNRELGARETIHVHGRDWLVTEVVVALPNPAFDRRVVAPEIKRAA